MEGQNILQIKALQSQNFPYDLSHCQCTASQYIWSGNLCAYIFYICTVNLEFLGHVEPPGHAQNRPHCTSADGLMHMELVCRILKNSRCVVLGCQIMTYQGLEKYIKSTKSLYRKSLPKITRTCPGKLKVTVTLSENFSHCLMVSQHPAVACAV